MNAADIKGIPLNTTDILQADLNIETKDRSNLFPWKGQFSPQLVEALLTKYSNSNFRILDPFAGSGTVLYEAGLLGLEAVASEINPSAYGMASTYRFINEKPRSRFASISAFEDSLRRHFSSESQTFRSPHDESDKLHESLLELGQRVADPLAKILFEALVIRLDLFQAGLNRQKVFAVWDKLKSVVLALPFSPKPITTFNCDARSIPLPPASVDLVVTSPPYINVFNYHQQYRASAEMLGWDLLEVAKSEIGSNRKHRSNRFLTVIQYCLDLAQCLSKLASTCKTSSRMIFIVGRESRVRGVPFYNGQIVGLLAVRCVGLQLDKRQERVFKNRFGQLIYEDILHFINAGQTADEILSSARSVAHSVLEQVQPTPEIEDDLRDALSRVRQIHPSPIYSPYAALKQKAN